jgi:flagellar basal body-associated protein FliL
MSHVRRKPTKRAVKTVKKKQKKNWISLIILTIILISGFAGIVFLITFS